MIISALITLSHSPRLFVQVRLQTLDELVKVQVCRAGLGLNATFLVKIRRLVNADGDGRVALIGDGCWTVAVDELLFGGVYN